MSVVNPPIYLGLAGNEYPAARFRRAHQLLLGGREGALTPGGLVVSQTDTPSLSVKVAAGAAAVNGDDSTGQGTYLVEVDAAVSVGPVSTPHATLPRVDRVVLEVLDQEGTGTGGGGRDSDLARLRIVAGTPSASPAPAAEPASSITLALVTVPASASSLLDASIADARTVVWRVAGELQTADLDDEAVTTGKIADEAITAAKLSAEVIGTDHLDDEAVTTGKIAPGAVTASRTGGGLGLTAIDLINSWANAGAGHHVAGCRKDFLGRVHLRGLVVGGSSVAIGWVPSGYRPSAAETFPIARYASGAPSGAGAVTIGTNGSIILDTIGFAGSAVSLSGISYEAA